MKVLVTGGAGYVGSVSVRRLLEEGHEVVVIDSLETGHRDAVPGNVGVVVGNLQTPGLAEDVMRSFDVEAVLHCAGRALVGESMADPGLYYGENVIGGIRLLDAMVATGVRRLVFSSSCASYGWWGHVIDEATPQVPVNPYGETKRVVEQAMRWYAEVFGLETYALRYWNVAGASGDLFERHDPETHLIPNALAAAAEIKQLTVFGADYDTPDGTCIRDYVHVEDLADAHLLALRHDGKVGLTAWNVGTGRGHSVREVIAVMEAVTGRHVPRVIGKRRPGDPARLVSDVSKIRTDVGWVARRSLEEMVGSAWRAFRAE